MKPRYPGLFFAVRDARRYNSAVFRPDTMYKRKPRILFVSEQPQVAELALTILQQEGAAWADGRSLGFEQAAVAREQLVGQI